MKDTIVLVGFVFILSVILIFLLDNTIEFNPFKECVRVPETFVGKYMGDGLTLNKNTNLDNPLKKNSKTKKRENKHHKNLVFTSAGDKTNFDNLWVGNNQNYDIMVVYYGNNDNNYQKYSKKVDYILNRKGSKFQNFHYVYENHRDIIDKYERFFILDDDIIFGVDDINKMFDVSKKYNLDICGPTFKKAPECKISHEITVTKNKNQIRYTNFVEVNVPLFNKKALDKLMKYYDPILIGWGIDFLYIWANGVDKKQNYALIDNITCINPQDESKDGKRELYNLKNADKRAETFMKYAKKLGIKSINMNHKTWKIVKV